MNVESLIFLLLVIAILSFLFLTDKIEKMGAVTVASIWLSINCSASGVLIKIFNHWGKGVGIEFFGDILYGLGLFFIGVSIYSGG